MQQDINSRLASDATGVSATMIDPKQDTIEVDLQAKASSKTASTVKVSDDPLSSAIQTSPSASAIKAQYPDTVSWSCRDHTPLLGPVTRATRCVMILCEGATA